MLTSLDAVNPRRDLLLTDIDMPGMSGRDLAHQVLARFPSLRVLLMSAQADNERLDAVGAAGPDLPILEKPFKIGALIDMVERALAV
jgi:CheY-like chemotaxis protein